MRETQLPTRPIARLGTTEHTRSAFVTDEGFLSALYRGDFIYSVRDYMTCEYRERHHTLSSIEGHLPPFRVLRGVESGFRLDLYVKGDDWWANLCLMEGSILAEFGVNSLERGQEIAKAFHDALAQRSVPQQIVRFEVWSGKEFPNFGSFKEVPWESIETNYASTTRRGLRSLLDVNRETIDALGKVLIFCGPPGTGKTWAIRSLLSEWRSWTTPVVVTDPEHALRDPAYLMNVIDHEVNETTRVLLMEDADAVVAPGTSHDGGLARLLNVTDGIIGVGSDALFLLSTNVRPSGLDKALTRPGRCLGIITFDFLSIEEANRHLGERGPATAPMSLAEVYHRIVEVPDLFRADTFSTGQYL